MVVIARKAIMNVNYSTSLFVEMYRHHQAVHILNKPSKNIFKLKLHEFVFARNLFLGCLFIWNDFEILRRVWQKYFEFLLFGHDDI